MKEIFFTFDGLVSHKNITIKIYEPERKKTVLENTLPCEGKYNGFYTILRNPVTQQILLYYRASHKDTVEEVETGRTCVVTSQDGLNFTKPKLKSNGDNVIHQGTCVNHNFSVMYHPRKKKLWGLGGQNRFAEGHLFEEQYEKEARTSRYLIPPSKPSKFKSNGLYLLTSKDGLSWKWSSKLPWISGNLKNAYDFHSNFQNKYDGTLSLIYDTHRKMYWLFCRANPKRKLRHIQYVTSSDGKEWSRCRLIELDPPYQSKHLENLYLAQIMPYPGTKYFIGFTPYFSHITRQYGILLLMSKNGQKWKRIKLLHQKISKFKFRNSVHSVNGLITSNDGTKFFTYLHHNYFNFNPRKPLQIVCYQNRLDGFTSFYSKDGRFSFKAKAKFKRLIINFKTKINGHLTVKVNQQVKKITGDHLKFKINFSGQKNDLIIIELVRAEIFSIIFKNNLKK